MDGGGPPVSRRSLLESGIAAVLIEGVSLSQFPQSVQGNNGDGWKMFQHDTANTGYNSSTTGPRGDLNSNWSFETSNSVYSAPVVTGGRAYVADSGGVIYSINKRNGTGIWKFETNQSTSSGSHTSSPALVNDTLYIGSLDQRIYAISASDGAKRWTAGTGGSITSSPTPSGNTVYIGSNDGSVYALGVKNGRKQWSYPTVGEVHATPAVVGSTVYIGADASPYQEDNFYALDSQNGSKKWSFEAAGSIAASAVVSGDAVYIGDTGGTLYCLNSSNGSARWNLDTGGAIISTLVVTEKLVCAVAGEAIYAVDKQDGTVAWMFDIGYNSTSDISASESTLYVGDSEGFVRGLDLQDGLERARFNLNDSAYGVPAVVSNSVYIGGDDGYLHSLTDTRSAPANNASESTKQGAGQDEQRSTSESSADSQTGSTVATGGSGKSDNGNSEGLIFGLSVTDSILSILASIVAILIGIAGNRRRKKRY